MKKKFLLNLEAFNAWKLNQIEEYKNCWAPAASGTKNMESPIMFPCVVVFDDFNDADDGLYFFYEFVYFNDFLI